MPIIKKDTTSIFIQKDELACRQAPKRSTATMLLDKRKDVTT